MKIIWRVLSNMVRVLGIDVGLRNLALCKVTVTDGAPIDVEEWMVLDVLGDKNAKKISIEDAVRLLLDALSIHDHVYSDVDMVAIESQPVGRAATGSVRNKVVSHVIQTFFEMRGISTTFLNPKNKLCKEFVAEHVDCEHLVGDQNTKKRYAVHKKAAIDAVQMLVPEQFSPFWQALKKKDDAADSFLVAAVVGRTLVAKRKKPKKK